MKRNAKRGKIKTTFPLDGVFDYSFKNILKKNKFLFRTFIKVKSKDKNPICLETHKNVGKEREGWGLSRQAEKAPRKKKKESQRKKHAAASFDCLVNLDLIHRRRGEGREQKRKRQKQRSTWNSLCCFDSF